MKGILIGGAFIISTCLGFLPNGISKAKPFWWKLLLIISGLLTILMGLGIQTGGSFVGVSMVAVGRESGAKTNLYAKVLSINDKEVTLIDNDSNIKTISFLNNSSILDLKINQKLIIETSFDRTTKKFTGYRVLLIDPYLVLPLIPQLEERARNLYFHVPTAWLTQLAWFIAFGYAIAYLRTRKLEYDMIAESAAIIGFLFCILATTTGAVWAKFNWGKFWNWDPRQTSIFIVMLIYGAYFALRSSLNNQETKSKISSIYLILLCLPVVFLLFVLPRLMDGLHPGSMGDSNSGPVLSAKTDSLDFTKQVIYSISLFHFILLYFWLVNISSRTKILKLNTQNDIFS
ncbi:MAG: cytochrome c biogenesis protein CcsA [Chlorobiota bacterium]|nr:cytochrome c biogenesis protein CcsA [Chlorobiota bacterium]QQS67713.1 MAG: cytochrome c biogenesis protein CcsA [Chlorobiota bacterium]